MKTADTAETPPTLFGSLPIMTLAFPPAGLVLLWRSPHLSTTQKFLRAAALLCYSVLYAAALVWVLMKTTSLEVEWRGGFPPVLTFAKTIPDFDAVEAHRADQETISASTASYRAAFWNQFRGPNRDGHYTEQPILTDWPQEGPPLLWRQPVGGGYAAFVIGDGLAFTLEQRRREEVVSAYDIDTGLEIWAHGYDALFQESMGGDGPRATPAFDHGRLYSLGAVGDLLCLEAATGKVLWHRNILTDNNAGNLSWAMSASPLVADDKVIVLPGGRNDSSVVAYNKYTGEPVWRNLDDKAAYASPMLVELAGQRHLLVATARRVAGLAVEDGQLLWEYPWTVAHDNQIAQPVILDQNRFLISAGYGTGSAAVEVTRDGPHFSVRELWRNRNLKNKFTSSVFWEGYVYGLDESILTCIDVETGRRMWKDGRYGYGQVLLAQGHLIVLSGNGDLALVRATPERHHELLRFPVFNGKTWNHPALADGRLFIRNAVEMACFDLRPGEGAAR